MQTHENGPDVCACVSPNFQTAQFQSNILIHLISQMMHVVTLDLDKHTIMAQML